MEVSQHRPTIDPCLRLPRPWSRYTVASYLTTPRGPGTSFCRTSPRRAVRYPTALCVAVYRATGRPKHSPGPLPRGQPRQSGVQWRGRQAHRPGRLPAWGQPWQSGVQWRVCDRPTWPSRSLGTPLALIAARLTVVVGECSDTMPPSDKWGRSYTLARPQVVAGWVDVVPGARSPSIPASYPPAVSPIVR